MAFIMGKGAYLSVNSVDVSGEAYKEDQGLKIDQLDNTTHGTSFHKTAQAGLIGTTFKYSLYYSRARWVALVALATGRTAHPLIYGEEGQTAGMARLSMTDGFIMSLDKGVTVDGIETIDVEHSYGATPPTYDVFT